MGHHDANEPKQPWKGEQWASDEDATTETEHKATWNRHQWASDNPGTSPDTIGGVGADEAAADAGVGRNDVDDESADMEHISGRGMPSGESHWERVDRDR